MLHTMQILLVACKQTPPHQLHAQTLEQPATEAAVLCAEIGSMELRADCTWRVVEELATTKPELCTTLCQDLPGIFGQECWFLLGEHGDDPAACANAGPMADECRMHLVGRRLMGTRGDFSDDDGAEDVFVGLGLSLGDDRPWSAWYRMLLSRQAVLDRSACTLVADPWRRDICVNTAIPLFHDRLNMARDKGLDLCTGVPAEVAYVAEPELDAALDQRRLEDLCP